MSIRFLPVVVLAALASCTAPTPPPPAPTPTPTPKPVATPRPAPVAQQPVGDWIDWPIEAGNWVYRKDARGSIALFGPPGEDALITFRCDRTQKRIFISRAYEFQTGVRSFSIRTHSARKDFSGGLTGGTPEYVAAMIGPKDSILDAMAYTRGRIAIEVTAQRNIAIPIWSEVPRVIDDCRG